MIEKRLLSVSLILVLSVTFLLVSNLTGCAPTGKGETLTVGAASANFFVFQEMADKFEKEYGIKIDYNFAATGMLYQQIKQGGPMDVFVSADEKHVDMLVEEGMIDPADQKVYAEGRIVIASLDGEIQEIEDLKEVDIVAIANPEHAPYGVAARQALKNAGVLEEISDKLIYGSNLRDAQRYLETEEADAAILSISMVKGEGKNMEYSLIDEELYSPVKQKIGILNNAIASEKALQFFEFVTNTEIGRDIMESYGFKLP